MSNLHNAASNFAFSFRVTHNETSCNVNTTYSRKSTQFTFKVVAPVQPTVAENSKEDIELTETFGRIYDTPMKSSGDSSMEITQGISGFVEPEIVCPLNLTKESNRTPNLSQEHIVEVEILNKSGKSNLNSSCMETTEILGANLIMDEKAYSGLTSIETTEIISKNSNKNEKCEADTSSMDITEVICDGDESIKSQSLCFESLQYDPEDLEAENLCEEIEYVSMRDTSNVLIPPRKSIFEMNCPKPMSADWRVSRKSIFATENTPKTPNDRSSIFSANMEETDPVEYIKCTSVEILDSLESSKSTLPRPATANNSVTYISKRLSRASLCPNQVNEELVRNVEYAQKFQLPRPDTLEIDYSNLSMPLLNRPNERAKLHNCSLQSLSQGGEKSSTSDLQIFSQVEGTKFNSCQQLLSQPEDKTVCNNSSMQLASQPGEKTKYDNRSMQLASQPEEQEETKHHDSSLPVLSQPEEKTKYDCSMELLSQETDKGKDDTLGEPLSLDTDGCTKEADLSAQMLSQEPENKTNYNPVGMELMSQEEDDKMKNNTSARSNPAPATLNKTMNSSTIDEQKTGPLAVLSDSLSTPILENNFEENVSDCSTYREAVNATKSTQPTSDVENGDIQPNRGNEQQNEITQKSDDNSSGNDSNSPLTVGVNFSIIQKNKETRVEFSGTIDSNKKKKSISNVQVNIINNKIEKKSRSVKELRFSMPATTKVGPDTVEKPEFSATFTDFSTPNPGNEIKSLAEVKEQEECDVECPQEVSKSDKSSRMACNEDPSEQINLHLSSKSAKYGSHGLRR